MSTREFYAERFKTERPVFVKVLKALPDDQLDYKPHERNQSAGDIAWMLACEIRALVEMFDTGNIHWNPGPPPALNEIVSEYERQADELEKRLASADDAKWDSPCGMHFGGQLMATMPVRDTSWFFLFDAIHHRGQLSAYLRPMGGKVPAIYGPSADEKGGM